MIRRPKPGESEEDLLRLQEEFLAREVASSANVVKKGDKRKNVAGTAQQNRVEKDVVQLPGADPSSGLPMGATSDPPKKKSKFRSSRPAAGDYGVRGQRIQIELDRDEDPEVAMERHDTHITSVLSKIMEHDTSNAAVHLPRGSTQGFPTALHRGHTTGAQNGKPHKKRSLFAQQFESSTSNQFGVSTQSQSEQPIRAPVSSSIQPHSAQPMRVPDLPLTTMASSSVEENMEMRESIVASPQEPHVISGAGLLQGSLDPERARKDIQQIHQENLGRLSAMSEEEILQEQQKLRQMLDPNLLKFLQSKGPSKPTQKPTSSSTLTSKPQADSENDSMDTESSAPMATEPIPEEKMTQETSKQRVHFDDNAGGGVDDVEKEEQEPEAPPIEVKKEWVNMNKVESDKISWLKDMPKPSAKAKEGYQARFDFNGMLVARDADIPVREGLHHHGEEQEVPGYSLEELFTLSRSSVVQQRVLALQTLARVLYNCRISDIGGELMEPLVPKLLEAGVLFLFRWSLDDVNEGVITACIEGLAALLIQPGDESTSDRVFSWYRGSETTPMRPVVEDEEDESGQKIEDKEKSDPQLASQDVIKALLRMNVLERLRYILEVVRPPAPVVLNALAILIRIARHSQEATNEIMKCPRLMQTVFAEFLPLASWKSQGDVVSEAYNYPLIPALKLARVICQNGRHFAATLLIKYNLMSVVVRYASMEPVDMPMNIGEAFQLSTEAFRVWQICVSYGLACDTYRDLYPLLMQQLQVFQRLSILPLDSTHDASSKAANRLQMTRACTVLSMLEGVTHVAGSAVILQQKQTMRSDEQSQQHPRAPPPPIDWSHVSGLMSPLELCAKRWLGEMTNCSDVLEAEALSLAGSSLNFLASVYENWTRQPSYSPVDCLQHIEELVTRLLVPFMTSTSFYSVVCNLKSHSSVSHDGNSSLPIISALPDFSCHPEDQSLVYSCVRRTSSYGFAAGLLRLVTTLLKIHKGMAAKFCPIIESTYVTEYLKAVCKHPHQSSASQLVGSWARYEHHVLYYLVKLYYHVAQQSESCHQYSILYHSTALVLLTSLQSGQEHYVHDLLSTVLFHTDFLAEGRIGDPIASDLADMLTINGKEETAPSTNSSHQGLTRGELLQDAYDHLGSIRHLYMVYFGAAAQALTRSRARSLHQPHDIDTLTLPEFTGPLVPMDWIFLPLLHLYVEAQKAEMLGKTVKSFPPHILASITDTLRWVFMLETWRSKCLQMVPQAAKVARLYCIFLTGNDLFMEDAVSGFLWPILRIYTQPEYLKALDFNVPVPGVASFHDLYMSILTQYEAVSFGNRLFAHFILLPIQQQFNPSLRKAVWFDRVGVLRSLGLPLRECAIPLSNFLEPKETNPELVEIYLGCVASGSVRPSWSPIMYLVALSHLNKFLFSQDNLDKVEAVRLKLKMIRQVLALKDKVLQQQILQYQGLDLTQPLGFNLYPQLPLERLEILQAAEKR
ncbi:RNA polymerase II-associated protein 1-like [Amphiura filiformis]|uniref:RNA polymerase II-associated protein 1-like n=1 Tax=Amphiura filiformis TaxID=82378 RepID=UPI003B21CEB0